MHHYFPCKWRRKNSTQTYSFCLFILHKVSCTCAPKRSLQDQRSIQCAKRHRRQLVQTDNFAPPLSIEMYLATSGTFSVAGYEVCQVSPCRIQSTLVCIPTKGKGRIGLNQLRTHRELEQGLVPEWRVKYFDYKVGWLAKRTRQCFDR